MRKLPLALALAFLVPAPAFTQAEAEERFRKMNIERYGDCRVSTVQDALGVEASFSSVECMGLSAEVIVFSSSVSFRFLHNPPPACIHTLLCRCFLKFSNEASGEVVAAVSTPVSKTLTPVWGPDDGASFVRKALQATHVSLGFEHEVYTISLRGFNAAWAELNQRE